MSKWLDTAVAMLYLTCYLTLFRCLGIKLLPSIALSVAIVLMASMLEGVEIKVCSKVLRERLLKSVFINVSGKLIEQRINFNVSVNSELLINMAGMLIPLTTSALGLAKLIIDNPLNTFKWLTLTLFLIIAFNRLSLFIKGRGIGVPLVSATLISSLSSLLVSIEHLTYSTTPLLPFLYAYTSSSIAAVIGIDVAGLRKLAIYNARKVVMGGLGLADAVSVIPTTSSLLAMCIAYVLLNLHIS